MEEKIREAVADVLAAHGADSIAFSVERPTDLSHGDYAVNAALVAAKALGKSSHELASELVVVLREELGSHAASIEVAGPGFINITLSHAAISDIIATVQEAAWGRGRSHSGKRIFIEYSNPNAFKEMHAGHLVGSVVGESLSRLIENEDAIVARDTFGGDVGPNVAKALWALIRNGVTDIGNAAEIGKAYTQGSNAYEESGDAKAEIDALNTRIYDVVGKQEKSGALSQEDRTLLELWRKGREISMEEFRSIWKLLGTAFDYEFFDSDTTETGMRVVRDGLVNGVFKKSDGAIIYDGEAKGVHTMVFITSHDTPTYEAKDIGLAFLKEERWPSDEVIILTGNEQSGRFKTVLAALSALAPQVAAKMVHRTTGFLRLASGKMSSREGNVITAAGLIQEVIEKASEKSSDPLVAEQVAVGAVKYMILRQAPGSDIIFDPETSLSLEGDSGPYLQYALVRARKILSYASNGVGGTNVPTVPYDIERLIIHYPQVALRAAKELAPNLLVTYLSELAGAWNSFYAKEQVLGSPEEVYKQGVARAFATTMENGLRILAIPAPERM